MIIFSCPYPDIDNNGFLDENDFLCMALRACVVEGKGDCSATRLEEYKKLMKGLWDEMAAMADDDKVRAFTCTPAFFGSSSSSSSLLSFSKSNYLIQFCFHSICVFAYCFIQFEIVIILLVYLCL